MMVIKPTQVVTLAKAVLKFQRLVLLVLLVQIVPNAMFFPAPLTTLTLGTASPMVIHHTCSLRSPGQP
jgi:hypothetical protein